MSGTQQVLWNMILLLVDVLPFVVLLVLTAKIIKEVFLHHND